MWSKQYFIFIFIYSSFHCIFLSFQRILKKRVKKDKGLLTFICQRQISNAENYRQKQWFFFVSPPENFKCKEKSCEIGAFAFKFRYMTIRIVDFFLCSRSYVKRKELKWSLRNILLVGVFFSCWRRECSEHITTRNIFEM